ncbi:hypothetical protein ASD12_23645 [Mesorhizobium sp. Root102]|nr:hypothetical protein ASD12_23645 [Mesorhizobium sp. Root102]
MGVVGWPEEIDGLARMAPLVAGEGGAVQEYQTLHPRQSMSPQLFHRASSKAAIACCISTSEATGRPKLRVTAMPFRPIVRVSSAV